MPTVIGHHDVKDTDHWLASSKREEFFGPLGVSNIRTFVDPTNKSRVAVLMDVPDMDAVMAAMDRPGAQSFQIARIPGVSVISRPSHPACADRARRSSGSP